jgi:hypothetical protein
LFSDVAEKVPYEKIIRRVTFLERDQQESRMFLQHLANLRNSKVHKGESSDHQHQLLEYTADLMRRFIFYLIFNGDDFGSHAEFLEMADLPNSRAALDRRLLALERRIRFMDTKRHR